MEDSKIHPFSRTLGDGPYRFVGFFEINIKAGQMGRPYIDQHLVHKNFKSGAGTCAHCGHAILNIFQVQIGNGDVYGVGSDCIAKAGLPPTELSKIQKVERERQKTLRAKRKADKGGAARAELNAIIEDHAEELSKLVYGNQDLLSYSKWCSGRSSDGGIVLVLKKVKTLLGVK